MCRRRKGDAPSSIDAKYQVTEMLASGSFSVCHLARCRDCGMEVAVKSMARAHMDFDVAAVELEATVLKHISHPCCVELHTVIEDASHVHFVQELVPGGDLFERIFQSEHRITPSAARAVMRQLVEATRYLHSTGICHRDLKPENIMLMSRDPSSPNFNDIKITDFGLSTCNSVDGYSDCMTEVCGTPDYCAPEMLALALGPTDPQPYSCKVDVWSLGAILYTMLAKKTPFAMNGKNMKRKVIAVAEGEATVRYPTTTSFVPSVVHFISACMTCDPSQRPRAGELLEQSFFTLHSDDPLPSSVVAGREAPASCHGIHCDGLVCEGQEASATVAFDCQWSTAAKPDLDVSMRIPSDESRESGAAVPSCVMHLNSAAAMTHDCTSAASKLIL